MALLLSAMHTFVSPRARRELERVTDDPVDALAGVELLLDGDLVVGARLEASADADVEPFGVLAEHHEVDVLRLAALERAQPLVEQLHRAVVDVEVELEARAEQDVARVAVVGHAWIAERADEDGVELAQQIVAVGRDRDAGRKIMVRTPGQLSIQTAARTIAGRVDGVHRLSSNFFADAVAGNHCDSHRLHLTLAAFGFQRSLRAYGQYVVSLRLSRSSKVQPGAASSPPSGRPFKYTEALPFQHFVPQSNPLDSKCRIRGTKRQNLMSDGTKNQRFHGFPGSGIAGATNRQSPFPVSPCVARLKRGDGRVLVALVRLYFRRMN